MSFNVVTRKQSRLASAQNADVNARSSSVSARSAGLAALKARSIRDVIILDDSEDDQKHVSGHVEHKQAVIDMCASSADNTMARLREMASTIGIDTNKFQSKNSLCTELGRVLRVAVQNIGNADEESEFMDAHSEMFDQITTDLLLNPVKGKDGRWYNKNTYQKLVLDAGHGPVVGPYSRETLSKTIPPVDKARQTEVLKFARLYGLEIPALARIPENRPDSVEAYIRELREIADQHDVEEQLASFESLRINQQGSQILAGSQTLAGLVLSGITGIALGTVINVLRRSYRM
jgi:hypothetical protein